MFCLVLFFIFLKLLAMTLLGNQQASDFSLKALHRCHGPTLTAHIDWLCTSSVITTDITVSSVFFWSGSGSSHTMFPGYIPRLLHPLQQQGREPRSLPFSGSRSLPDSVQTERMTSQGIHFSFSVSILWVGHRLMYFLRQANGNGVIEPS